MTEVVVVGILAKVVAVAKVVAQVAMVVRKESKEAAVGNVAEVVVVGIGAKVVAVGNVANVVVFGNAAKDIVMGIPAKVEFTPINSLHIFVLVIILARKLNFLLHQHV